jgi:predicted HTH domain antitoxin
MASMTVRLPEEKLDRLRQAASAQRKSANALIEDAIDAYLPQLSDRTRAGISDDLPADLRLSLAMRLYDERKVSQSAGAEIAGMTRSRFIDALGRAGISAVQYSAEEIIEEGCRLQRRRRDFIAGHSSGYNRLS